MRGPTRNLFRLSSLERLEQIRHALKGRKIDVMMTLGSMESGYLGMPQSYSQAKRLQEYFLTHEEGEIITASRMSPPDEPPAWAALDTLEYEKRLLARNKTAVDEYIDQAFNVKTAVLRWPASTTWPSSWSCARSRS